MSRGEPTAIATRIAELCRPLGRVQLMEVCGTHTVSIFRHGLRSLLPANLRLVSGPGCPVCVTAQRDLDAACLLARQPGVILATYGDMLRVPGRLGSLADQRARGAQVRVVTSAMQALRLAIGHRDRPVVFFAVGFETTAPATAALVRAAAGRGADNLFVYACHKRIVPAMMALLDDPACAIDGFLCPGHVSVIIGSDAYAPIVQRYLRPCVVAGFEPVQILRAIERLVTQIARGDARLENAYPQAVSARGNRVAQRLLDEVFEPCDARWRGLGVIAGSGLRLRQQYARFDAAARFELSLPDDYELPGCRCGEVIAGRLDPPDCRLFGRACTPLRPLGPCMVSSEGTCAAWYRYGRQPSGIHRRSSAGRVAEVAHGSG